MHQGRTEKPHREQGKRRNEKEIGVSEPIPYVLGDDLLCGVDEVEVNEVVEKSHGRLGELARRRYSPGEEETVTNQKRQNQHRKKSSEFLRGGLTPRSWAVGGGSRNRWHSRADALT